jgi:hypothetical protein
MAYLGAQPNKTLTKTTSQSFNGTGSATVFTLNRAVNTGEELEVFVENVQQEPGSGKSYTASGTTLTFDEAPPSGTGNIYVIYRGQAEVTTRLEHDANAALAATTGAFSGNVGIGTANPTNFGGTTLQTNHGSTYSANLVSSGAYILQMIASATHGAMSMGARSNHHVAFTTNDTERMRITSGGAVGIGTSSPSQALEISGSAPIIRLTDTGASNNYSEINADYTSGSLQISADTANASSNSRIIFAVDNTERMRIDSSGNLGIGTLSPVSNSGYGGLTLNGSNGSILSLKDSDTEVARVVGSATEMSFQYGTSSVLTFKDGLSGGTERLRITSDGRLLHNTTSSTLGGDVVFKATNNNAVTIHNARGTSGVFTQISFSNNAGNAAIGSINRVNDASVQYNTTSDARLKENITDMTGAIARVKQLLPKRYSWVNEDLDAADQDGFLAHEAQSVVPIAVSGTQDEVDSDGNPLYMQMDYSKLVPLLTAALKESIAKIEALEARVTTLEGN